MTPQTAIKNLQKAIEVAPENAVIKIAAGNYLGTLDVGYIEVKDKYLSLVGGYNEDFSDRDPFKYMEAATRTPYGPIKVRWEADGDVIRSINVSVPAGTTAKVHCPDGEVRTLGSGDYGFGVELE